MLPPPLRPWVTTDYVHRDRARIFRTILRHGSKLLALDPWLPIPQGGTSFSFGQDRRPLPLGALLLLWRDCIATTGQCDRCTGLILAYDFSGFLAIGRYSGICINCCGIAYRRTGGLGTIARTVEPVLQRTPFFLAGSIYGGSVVGTAQPVIDALRAIGEWDLPGAEDLSRLAERRLS